MKDFKMITTSFTKMKIDLTTGILQDDIWCPIVIILFCTSDATCGHGTQYGFCSWLVSSSMYTSWHQMAVLISPHPRTHKQYSNPQIQICHNSLARHYGLNYWCPVLSFKQKLSPPTSSMILAHWFVSCHTDQILLHMQVAKWKWKTSLLPLESLGKGSFGHFTMLAVLLSPLNLWDTIFLILTSTFSALKSSLGN